MQYNRYLAVSIDRDARRLDSIDPLANTGGKSGTQSASPIDETS